MSQIRIYPVFTIALTILLLCGMPGSSLLAQQRALPYFPSGTYQAGIPSPDEVLGFPSGQKPVRYDQAIAYLQKLAAVSPRVQLVEFGETFEMRKLHYAVITSEENLARLPEIRSNIAKLADPRTLASGDRPQDIIGSTPAIAWMMYGIHGDEISSTDASLRLAYQLAAGTDTLTEKIRHELVVCIHPMENPDGRERFLAQLRQWNGNMVSPDMQSIQHTSVWPWGRGNHYLFDLNRDWMLLVNPESRARTKAIMSWNPQLVVDSHEMGGLDTYLFPPSREPRNPNINQTMRDWSKRFAQDQADAWDHFGWSYYTREWLEDWYPGYGSTLPFLWGAVSILYEQAGTDGSMVKRADGTILTFREAVDHQFVSSMANLSTAAGDRLALLEDFFAAKNAALNIKKKNAPKVFYLLPGNNPERARELVQTLLLQNVEISRASENFQMSDLHGYWSKIEISKTLPAGTYVIRLDQPLQPFILAMLEFDPHTTTQFLKDERESLLREKETRLYEVSAWSLPLAYNVETYWSAKYPSVKTTPVDRVPPGVGKIVNTSLAYGFVFDYADDRAVETTVQLLSKGYNLRAAQKPFAIAGHDFPRGSILLRTNENPPSLMDDVVQISQKTGATIYGVNTALSEVGPDLGGNNFILLAEPRIALLTGPAISTTSFSSLWFLLDRRLKIQHSVLDYTNFAHFDLRKYNVLILPSSRGGAETYQKIFGKAGVEKLKSWTEAGGTLVGIGGAAAFLADSAVALSKVKLRRQSLKELEFYKRAAEQEKKVGHESVDSLAFWNRPSVLEDTFHMKEPSKPMLRAMKQKDARWRLFQPRGAILRANLDPNDWLTFGTGDKVPVILYTSYAFLSKEPVEAAARLSDGASLRLAGLLWPEARTRWENTAYLTREKLGKGQMILFANDPYFRAYFHGSGRLLINALLLGPGMGASQGVPW